MSSGIGGDLSMVAEIYLVSGLLLPAAEGELRPGQRLVARVLELLSSGDVLFELGQNRVVGRTSTPLQPGDRVVLEVVTGGAEPELRLVTDKTMETRPAAAGQPPPVNGQGATAPLSARDLPVILRALAELAPGSVPIPQSGHEFLRSVAADLAPAVMEQIQRLLAPLQAGLPPAALATMIRSFFAQSGLFTENQLRGALKDGTQPQPLANQREMVSDLRLLLGELTIRDQPVPDAVRTFGDALLQQQLAVAERLAATGIGQFAIPFMLGEERVDVVFEWERAAGGARKDRPDQTISLGVFVRLKTLGAIEARVEWQPESLSVTFFVEREATCAIVEAGLSDLSEQLSLSGCSTLAARVRLRPDRTSHSPSPANRMIPGGTILNVMA